MDNWKTTTYFPIIAIFVSQLICISTDTSTQIARNSSRKIVDVNITAPDITLLKEKGSAVFETTETNVREPFNENMDPANVDLKQSNSISNSEIGNEDAKADITQLLNDTSTREISTDVRTLTDQVKYEMPKKWKSFCDLDDTKYMESKFTSNTRLTTITCKITEEFSGVWNMSDLRESFRSFTNSSLAFSVEIQCQNRSTISLSHPMQIYRLYKISVRGCTVMDYLAENSNEPLDTIPDSLRKVELRDNTVLIGLRNYVSRMRNVENITKEYSCMHEDTIESVVYSNLYYQFIFDMDLEQINLTELGEEFIHSAQRLEFKCIFVHLMVLDNTHIHSGSIYHMDFVTGNSVYDELLVYNVSYNYIQQLDDQQLKWSIHFPKLEMFDLSHNEISKIYRFQVPLHTSNRVTTINLQYNHISTITVKDLDRFKDIPMMFIDLRNNPINCNCSEELKELLGYIADRKHLDISRLESYEYIGQLQCASPGKFVGRTLASLNGDIVCEPEVEFYIVPLLCMSVAIVVVCIFLFITLQYRQEISIILFTRFNIIVPCYSRESFDSNKKFDAFVSYSSNEEEHIEKLFEDLEQPSDSRAHFKFCLHHRDFVPGKTIFDNVVASIGASRHTIILLSNHFLNSQYCLLEFQEAFRQSIMEQKRHLVIIMMEDIAEEKLPRDLRRCIKTFTYIRRDDYLFQRRLIYALSVKQKSKLVRQNSKHNSKSDSICTTTTSISTSANESLNKPINGVQCKSKIVNTSYLQNHTSESNDTFVNSSQTRLTNENEVNYASAKYNNKNIDYLNTKVHKFNNQTLELNSIPCIEKSPSLVEKKISNVCYDRSLSYDTGYGSERGSYCEKLSSEGFCMNIGEFP